MKIKLIPLLCILLLALVSFVSAGKAQGTLAEIDSLEAPSRKGLSIGMTGGVTTDIHQGDSPYRKAIDDPSCPVITTSSNRGYMFGITGEYQFNNWLALRSTMAFHAHQSYGKEELPEAKVLLPNPDDPMGDPIIVSQTVGLEGKWDYTYTSLGLSAVFDVITLGPGSIQGYLGLEWGSVAEIESRLVQQLDEPENQRFVTSSTAPSTRTVEIPNDLPAENISSSRFSLQGGIAYDYPLFNELHIQPGIGFDYSLTPVISDPDWKMHYLIGQIGIAIKI